MLFLASASGITMDKTKQQALSKHMGCMQNCLGDLKSLMSRKDFEAAVPEEKAKFRELVASCQPTCATEEYQEAFAAKRAASEKQSAMKAAQAKAKRQAAKKA